MKFASSIIAILFLAGSVETNEARRNRLMDEVEIKLTLPEGALPLTAYARYYTEEGGRIHGAFTTTIEKHTPGVGCAEMQLNFKVKDVPCPAVADLEPGHRRWVPLSDYPSVGDENCHGVQIMYNPANHSIEYAECAIPDY
jgi:hypothetical protein